MRVLRQELSTGDAEAGEGSERIDGGYSLRNGSSRSCILAPDG
jgi:hypothetical protein